MSAIECRLSTVLGAKRLKQSDVIRATGLAKGTLTELYHDRARRIDFGTLEKLCRFLDCQPGDLLVYVPEKKTPKTP
ncbi:MAG TPA: helix-turn-helix transcriptional regulator [Firmicutes bacterium]|nr:helix-turn-helix transcriptional regulator [Bacillota bacterium]